MEISMVQTTAFGFGSGAAWATPTTDAYGNSIATPTPILLGTLQDISIDFSGDVKELYGTQQVPVAVAAGKMKITGKAKWAQVNMANVASLFFGQPFTSAVLNDYLDTTGVTVAATVTPTVPGTGTWTADLGVRDVYGNIIQRVASAPTTGQYSVAAGVYTFASADVGKTYFVSFQYTATSTTSKSATFSNVAMGTKPVFRCDFFQGFQANAMAMTLYQCVATKFMLGTKLDDFLDQELDFSAFANGAGQVVSIGTSQ
jgi:hypothetical protein